LIRFGTHGGNGGNTFSVSSNSGFTKINVRSGALVDRSTFFSDNTQKGEVGGGGGEGPHNLNCNDGKIMGLKIRSGDRLYRIQVVCGKDQPLTSTQNCNI
jgi:hypothetical protein